MTLDPVADLYVQAADSSLDARLVRDKQRHRSESFGILQALRALVGMDEACLLIEAAVERANHRLGARHTSRKADALLYEFWTLDRPRSSDTSLRPRPGESAEDVVARVERAVK